MKRQFWDVKRIGEFQISAYQRFKLVEVSHVLLFKKCISRYFRRWFLLILQPMTIDQLNELRERITALRRHL